MIIVIIVIIIIERIIHYQLLFYSTAVSESLFVDERGKALS